MSNSLTAINNSGRSFFFEGYIDDFRLYNTALTDMEIQALYAENRNKAPKLDSPISDRTETEGQLFNFTIPAATFSDPDGDVLTWTASASGPTNWIAISNNNATTPPVLSGTPTSTEVGNQYEVSIIVDDGLAQTADSFSIAIDPAPVETSPDAVSLSNTQTSGGSIIDLADKHLVIENKEDASVRISANGNRGITVSSSGYVGIGQVANPLSELHIGGTVRAKKVIVSTSGADYVFEPGYNLKTLDEVREHIEAHGHLPDVPSAARMKGEGLSLGDSQTLLLQKIEELTLYLIEQEKRLSDKEALVSELRESESRNDLLIKQLLERIEKLERAQLMEPAN